MAPHLPFPPPPTQLEPVPLPAGVALDDLPTPALVVDVAVLERNIRSMAAHAASNGLRTRPHTKTHKCPVVGRLQMAAGATGLCCAKVGEAEVMASAGLDRLLVTSPVITADKIDRVVSLAARVDELLMVVDCAEGAQRLSSAAAAAGVEIGVVVDLDPGTHRTGVAMGEPALALADTVGSLPGLRFAGLQAYAGHLQHVHGFAERRRRALEIWEQVAATREAIERALAPVGILTGGGTGTFDIDVEAHGVTDVQVGSYLFMDREYREIGGREGELFESFETSLFVLATAISQPVPERITIDAGFKSMATDSVRPELLDVGGVRYHWGGDEHGILELEAPTRTLSLGDRVRLRVPHCDPTVNLYDGMWALRDGVVTEWWPIAARGRCQ